MSPENEASAIRRVRTQRAALACGAGLFALGVLVVVLQGGVLRASGAEPASGAAPSSSPSVSAEPVRYLPVGDGELPVLPGLAHGGAEQSHGEHTLQGGLQYTLPPGGWTLWPADGDGSDDKNPPGAVWDVSTVVTEPPGADHPGDWKPDPMAGSGATIELHVDPDAAAWQVPARDSGAWTADVPGADFVVITRTPSDQAGLVVWDVQVRRGDAGWRARLEFTDDDEGDRLATAFVGSLTFPADGTPDPTQAPVGGIGSGTPAGWQQVTDGALTFAVPADWTPGDLGKGDSVRAAQLEGGVASHGFKRSDGSTIDLHWRVLAQDYGPGENAFPIQGPSTQQIDVPGADYAMARTILGPYWGDPSIRSYSADVSLHQAGGDSFTMNIDVPADDEGLALLKQVLGSLRFP